ncbi:hypothetical protein LPJ74_006482, partial [Coemansia sp. RSA 1843]
PDNDFDPPDIEKWRIGTDKAVAKAKRNHMDTNKLFASNIVSQFIKNPSYRPLMKLVRKLRKALFNNPNVSAKGRGTLKAITFDSDDDSDTTSKSINSSEPPSVKVYWDDGCDENELDQFKRRATCAGKISDALLKVIKDAHEGA